MSLNNVLSASVEHDEIIQRGSEYENWVQADENANDPAAVESPLEPAHRGRGRPRVARRRDESAIEKRRAQVREAQRAYQKRKDEATATNKRRVDELLQVFSDLSADVECLLHTASEAGHMSRDDNLSTHIQRLWASYNKAINADCVKPELRLLQIKNENRIASYHSGDNLTVTSATTQPMAGEPNTISTAAPNRSLLPFNPTETAFNFVRFEEAQVLQPFQRMKSFNLMDGRNIFEIVKERQAAMKEADKTSNS